MNQMKQQSDTRSLLDAVKTPLGFFALAVLLIEGILTSLAAFLTGEDLTFLIHAMPLLLGGVVVLVALIAVFRPEALWGKRYSALEKSFAESLAVEMFEALDGYMSNLDSGARSEAYELLRDAIMNSNFGQQRETGPFCETLVTTILRRAQIRTSYRQGVLRASPTQSL